MEEKKPRFTASDHRFIGRCVFAAGILIILLSPILGEGVYGWRLSREGALGAVESGFYLASALSFQAAGALVCWSGGGIARRGDQGGGSSPS